MQIEQNECDHQQHEIVLQIYQYKRTERTPRNRDIAKRAFKGDLPRWAIQRLGYHVREVSLSAKPTSGLVVLFNKWSRQIYRVRKDICIKLSTTPVIFFSSRKVAKVHLSPSIPVIIEASEIRCSKNHH